MTENKISLKEEYKNLIPTMKYVKKYVKKTAENIDKLLSIDKDDYELAKDDYAEYLKILYQLIECKNEEQLKGLKKDIKDNNPWKEALKTTNQFRSIADSDRSILEPLIEKEIKNFKNKILSKKLTEFYDVNNIVELLSNNSDEKEKLESIIDKDMATKFYEAIFSDFEHAFDGNFEDPRVLILGINPKLDIKHKSYNLIETYREPFNNRRKTLINKNESKDYYFKPKGFFFSGLDDSPEANDLKEMFKELVIKEDKVTPYALLELYPYATKDTNEWYGGISISEKKILDYMKQNNFLPSQIWLLCLATFTIKKALLNPKRELYIFCTKREKTFLDSFLKNYIEGILEITSTSNVKILLKKDDRNRSFNVNNINPYFENSGIVFAENDFKEFFRVIWNIPRKQKKRKK
jgi:hypothetical protein